MGSHPPDCLCCSCKADKERRAFLQREEKWALLYLVDWEKDVAGNPLGPWPAIHGYYDTEKEAIEMRNKKTHPEKYWVRKVRNYTGIGY